ncbi:MAG: hypothetical protein CMB53_01375 [Euryarchaeota archaeon]|nr:hypothetical protein [Euryarchaeota archaeon]|tara:strand:+ start:634 stop:1437 length:804 start_codon:yes stop_codon:yes gene_type:complete
MGLLEKAGKITDDKTSDEEAPAAVPAAVVLEPEPVAVKPKKEKKAKKQKKAKKPRAKKQKKPRSSVKELPDGFELAGRGRRSLRFFVDFTVNFGLIIGLVIFGLVLTYTDITWPLVLVLLLSIFNMVVMPIQYKSSMGNVISRTTFINSRGDSAIFLYHMLKNINIPAYLIFFGGLLIAISAGTVWTTATKITVGLSIAIILIPFLDWIFRRQRKDNLGLWEVVFGGVWLVRSTETTTDGSKFMKRLESMAQYAETKGFVDDEEDES